MLRSEAPWLKRPDSANSKRESLKSTRSIESLIGEILQKVHILANFWPLKHSKKRISEFSFYGIFLLLAYENFSTFNPSAFSRFLAYKLLSFRLQFLLLFFSVLTLQIKGKRVG
jgi:hypothetical protein